MFVLFKRGTVPKTITNMKTVQITLFAFNELNATAQQKAISEHLDFMDSEPESYENEEGEMVSEYIEHTETDAYESINANDYLFFNDGTLASVIHFPGKHPRAGQAEFTLHGETVSLA